MKWALIAVLLTPLAAFAGDKNKRPNDPVNDPYTENDPAILKAAGIVSLGGFDFGKSGWNTAKCDEFMIANELRWVETAHFKIGFGLGSYKVKLDEKKKIIAELTRLKVAMPKIIPETGLLDPWLRLYLIAQRTEDIYKRFCGITFAESQQFPDGTPVYSGGYNGAGPYLGMKEKFEIMILPTEASQVAWLLENAGLRIRNTQRWHFIDRGAITVVMHAQQGQLRNDAALHGHIAFNLAHNLYDGMNHYSYDTPTWLHEGLAHFMEREIDPEHNSFDSGEGAVADQTSKANWKPEVVKLINSGEATRMAELLQLKNFSDLKLVHHFTTWSMIDFLVKTKPTEFGKFLWALKRNYDAQGLPTGANLHDWHRKVFKEQLGWSYAEFDEAWRAWVLVEYTRPPGKDKDKDAKEKGVAEGKDKPKDPPAPEKPPEKGGSK
ncbi:MAG: hypothetical protein SGI72_16305 [Planctomycetota bacterium]|nr:hypothetical protein [Planctomycetota bacterium]